MDEYQSLSHTVWDCKYHVVWIPKCRRKVLYEELRKHLGQVFRTLALQKESKILEGHLMVDHVHMLISIPPKYGVSQVVGLIKGKSAIHIARDFQGRKRDFTGHSFWARGYLVSTVGRDEKTIREYIKKESPKTDVWTNCTCSKTCHLLGSSGKRVPAQRERTVSVCCELALWRLFDFLAKKGLHRVAQGKRSATLGRTGSQIIYNTLKGLHKKNI